jgi:hypothetical protein
MRWSVCRASIARYREVRSKERERHGNPRWQSWVQKRTQKRRQASIAYDRIVATLTMKCAEWRIFKGPDMSCPTVDARVSSFECRQVHRPGSAPIACEEGVLAHSALRLMTHLVHVLPGYFSMRYREVTSNVDTIDIFDSTNKYEAGIGIKHMPEFIWVNHNHVS